jgi:hypothetical protein
MNKFRSAILAVFLAPSISSAQPGPAERVEVPVREILLSDGTRRYAVSLKVGSTEILAGLDSGSTGLRILPNTLGSGDAEPSSHGDSYSYLAGTKLSGIIANGVVTIGGLTKRTSFQLVQRVGCTDEKPRCPAEQFPIEKFGIQGNGLPGEGFKAILGVNMADADVSSLFKGIGVRSWIIELPQPGDPVAGRIILNPTAEETKGFVNLPILRQFANQRGNAHDAVEGCLMNDASHQKICGAVVLDTGAPGIRIVTADHSPKNWPSNTPATLLFADGGHVRLAEGIVTDRRDQASHLIFQQRSDVPMPMVMAGLTPYFGFSILYDPSHGTVGFQSRKTSPQGPQPMVVVD